MSCINSHPVYSPHTNGGLTIAVSRGDGYTIALQWDRAFPSDNDYSIGYNIYYSTNRNDVFSEGVKFVAPNSGAIEDGYLTTEINNLTPGTLYYFAVRAFEYDPSWYNLAQLPDAYNDLKVYPETLLSSNITTSSLTIPLISTSDFPNFGIIKIGTELIRYSSKTAATLILTSATFRGYLSTNLRYHQTDGYDGTTTQDPVVSFWSGLEEDNVIIQQETASFSYPNYAYTTTDGYKTVDTDLLTSNLSSHEADNINFRPYDYAGWHRTDPVLLINGTCLDTYIGGEHYCADGYLGVGRQLRRLPINELVSQRLEELLTATGTPCVLLKRQRTGIRCTCFLPTNEYPDHRCPYCYGTGFKMGYSQFFSPRRSDGKILVRFGTGTEDVKSNPAGLESELNNLECWTLTVPVLKDRDVIVRYDSDNLREYYYEILDVTRNMLFLNEYGAQKFRAQRIRKTDKIYQVKFIDSTATIPEEITTSVGYLRSSNNTSIPHTHTIKINENITSLSQITQTTSITLGHNHEIIEGIVQESRFHTHTITI